MLDLTRMADLGEMTAGYDDECGGQQLHLLDHVKATPLPDGDVLSLEHQVGPLCLIGSDAFTYGTAHKNLGKTCSADKVFRI
jgi:hypothetical protein